jgi:archaellum component FlaC
MEYIKMQDNPSYIRDINSGAVVLQKDNINRLKQERINHSKQIEKMMQYGKEINSLKEEIGCIKKLINTILEKI